MKKDTVKNFCKNILGYSFYPLNKLSIKTRRVINRTLLFHSIDDKMSFDKYGFSVKLNNFKNYINFLKDSEYQFHDFTHNLNSTKSISITFDDGYKNILPAVEYLIKLNIPCIIFVITSKINDNLYLSKDEICQLSKNKLITIGSHSHNHLKYANLNSIDCSLDIEKSVKIIEDLTNQKVNSFAFPHGSYKFDNLKILNKYNLKKICTSNYGYNITFDNLINRIEIIEKDNLNTFSKKINGFYDYLYLKKIFN